MSPFQIFRAPAIQCTLGFATMGLAANPGFSDLNPIDGPPSLHNSDHGYNDLKFVTLYSEIGTVNTIMVIAKSSEMHFKLFLATTWL